MMPSKTIRFSALGWGFLTAWGIESILMDTALNTTAMFVLAGIITSTSNIVAFLLVALAVHFGAQHLRRQKRQNHTGENPVTWPIRLLDPASRWPAILAATLMFCGSLASLIIQSLDPTLQVARLTSLALASFGYVWLTVFWGRHYASRDIQEIETCAIWSTLLCALLYLLALVTVPIVSKALWLCLPLATCACLLRCERNTARQAGAGESINNGTNSKSSSKSSNIANVNSERVSDSANGLIKTNRGEQRNTLQPRVKDFLLPYRWFGLSLLVASISVSLPPSLNRLTTLPHGFLGFTMLSGLILAVILVIYYTIFARRINFATFYRLLVPLTVGGLFLAAFSPPILPFAGFGLVFAAQWGLYLLLWIYLAEICHRTNVNPILVFVAGRLIFELGFLITYLLGNLLPTLTTDYHVPFVFIAFGIAVFLILTTLLPVGDDETQRLPLARPNDLRSSSDQEMMAEHFQKRTQRLAQRYALSPRESEIVQYLVRGYSLPSIRNELFIAKSTIDTHTQRIYRKCGIHSRQELHALFNYIEDQDTDSAP
jgi:DNA-binding CsgD family transcriptional regulator